MIRKLITSVVVSGGLAFSVFLAVGGSVQEQTDYLADAGVTPNRNCTCPVRLDEDFALDAGLGLYQRVTFPCAVTTPDAGLRDVQLPPMPAGRARDAIDVVDWNDCTLSASTAPVAAKWGDRQPFVLVPRAAHPWCRAKLPLLPCLLLDGGSFDTPGQIGGGNIGPCSERLLPLVSCERVSSKTIYAGDDTEAL